MCVSAYLWKRRCNVCAKVSIRNSKQRSRTAILKDLGFKSDMRRRTMKKRIKVEVKAKHIKQGTPRSGSSCPIALALYDTPVLKKIKAYVRVWTKIAIINGATINLPRIAREFI